jgi:hypothetical protein
VPRRRSANRLDDAEVSLIKAMVGSGRFAIRTSSAIFTRPGRTVNYARIVEIREAMRGEPTSKAARRFAHQPIATEDELAAYLARFPDVDPRTGLHLVDDELAIKAREAMLFAVQAFNNPTTHFKAEIFIVAAMIAWTLPVARFLQAGERGLHLSRQDRPASDDAAWAATLLRLGAMPETRTGPTLAR